MTSKEKYPTLDAGSLDEWRDWLEENHTTAPVIWLVFRKKGSGPVPFDYGQALDEALCYGWIDSLLKSIDETSYMRKFNPRQEKSTWSEVNKKKVARLQAEGRMKEAGLAAVEAGKRTGMWDKGVQRPELDDSLPASLQMAFLKHPDARDVYFALPAGHQKQYNVWINHAKQAETVRRRVDEAIARLEQGLSLGLK
ncbi:MAG: YdeI/OmpD-associated family protein [Bacteroidales bacterium]